MIKSSSRRRRRWLTTLITAAVLLLPAAVAWACTPSAAIGFDSPRYQYYPGDTVTVTGRGFQPNTPVTVEPKIPGVAPFTVMADSLGFFRRPFGLPSTTAPASYTVVATSGPYTAREALTVVARPAAAPAPGPGPASPAAPSRRAKAVARCKRAYRSRLRRARRVSSGSRRAASRRKAKRYYRACVRRAKTRYPA